MWDTPRNQRVRDHEGNETAVFGKNAVGFEPYPQMLYKAFRHDKGKAMCGDISGLYTSDPVQQAKADAFTKRCQMIVRDEDEARRAKHDGWRASAQEALDLLEAQQQDIAQAAAEAAYATQRMTEKARREYDAHDAASEGPAIDVPAPRKKPGRKPKVRTEAMA